MKSILIIGLGQLGYHLALKMTELGNFVVVVDNNEDRIEEHVSEFSDAQIGDCTNEAVLRAIGVRNFDICFVTIGENFQSSLVVTMLLKKCGAKYIVAKASQDVQVELLKTIGADEVIFPERELSEKLAMRYNVENIFDYIPLTDEYSIYEIPIKPEWEGHTVMKIDVRRKYKINIVAVKRDGVLNPVPGGDYVFSKNDHLVVIGKSSDVFKLTAKI